MPSIRARQAVLHRELLVPGGEALEQLGRGVGEAIALQGVRRDALGVFPAVVLIGAGEGIVDDQGDRALLLLQKAALQNVLGQVDGVDGVRRGQQGVYIAVVFQDGLLQLLVILGQLLFCVPGGGAVIPDGLKGQQEVVQLS